MIKFTSVEVSDKGIRKGSWVEPRGQHRDAGLSPLCPMEVLAVAKNIVSTTRGQMFQMGEGALVRDMDGHERWVRTFLLQLSKQPDPVRARAAFGTSLRKNIVDSHGQFQKHQRVHSMYTIRVGPGYGEFLTEGREYIILMIQTGVNGPSAMIIDNNGDKDWVSLADLSLFPASLAVA